MGYFSNGTEGMIYEEKYCSDCINGISGCAVWDVHLIFNGEEKKDEVLNILIPRSKNGLHNDKCSMFLRKI